MKKTVSCLLNVTVTGKVKDSLSAGNNNYCWGEHDQQIIEKGKQTESIYW